MGLAWDVDPILSPRDQAMSDRVRLAELLGSLSFAGDLGRGQPMGHVLRATRIAMAIAGRLGLPAARLPDVYFTSLLLHAGCTAGATEFAAFLASDELSAQKDFCLCDPNNTGQLFGWLGRNVARGRPLPARALRMLQLLSKGEKAFQDIDQGCSEVGARIAARLGMSEETQLGLYHICETWNGKGPHRLKGEDIPLAARIVNVAMILEVFFSERGVPAAREAAADRAGRSFDPAVAAAARDLCDDAALWESLRQEEPWAALLDLEPPPLRYETPSAIDDFAYALADIVDLKSTRAAAHSRRAAELAGAMAGRLRLPEPEVVLVRRAALVHDVGLVAVPSFLLDGGGAWSEADFERFRLHSYYTERILSRSPVLTPVGAAASAHHEELDGSGYHRGLTAAQLPLPARVTAVAAAYLEVVESQRESAPDPERALRILQEQRAMDPDCLAVLAAEVGGDGVPLAPRRPYPAGLTEREVEVLRLIARGLNLKQAAERLVISEHTVRHHLESVYGKAGVSSRAGVTLFAVENGLLA
jgi:HD-GYP domain-containing protein (c-di-GMP phosphodiesterase class II)/DNA-binding CsgD family transcriptional regulator